MGCIFGGCRRDYDYYPVRRPFGPRGIAPGRDRYDRNDRYDRHDRRDRYDRYNRYDDRYCSDCRSMFPRYPWR